MSGSPRSIELSKTSPDWKPWSCARALVASQCARPSTCTVASMPLLACAPVPSVVTLFFHDAS